MTCHLKATLLCVMGATPCMGSPSPKRRSFVAVGNATARIGKGGPGRQSPLGLGLSEDVEDMASFTEWYGHIADEERVLLPPSLRNAARGLVRHRGHAVHPPPKGKCKRVADDIKTTLIRSQSPWADVSGES